MNKSLYASLMLILPFLSFSQDTLSATRMHHNHMFYTLANASDTSIHSFREDGSLESVRPINNGTYERYYPSGQIMWEQERSNNQANGLMKFYSKKGRHVGTLEFKNDTIIDTLFIDKKNSFIYGRFTYNATIHGGMMRPDGTSNTSHSEGPRIFAPLYLVKHDKTNEIQKYSEFSADYDGFFFEIVTKGSYGLFPKYYDILQVTNEMGAPKERRGSGMDSGWNIDSPIEINENYCYLPLHVHSIGYAP